MSAATTQTQHAVSEFLLDRNVFDPNSAQSLANFTSVIDVHEVKSAFGRRGIRKLVDVLASQETSDEEKLDSLSLITPQLTNQESKISALQDGAVEALSSLLSSSNPALVTATCVALGSLSTQLQVRWVWTTAGVLQRLCPLLSDTEDTVAAVAAHALCSFVSFADGAGAVFDSQDALQHLVASISKSQWSVLPLAAFLPHFRELAEEAVRLNAVEACVAWANPQSNEDVLLQACRAFRSMAVSPEGKQRCLKAGVVDAMLQLLAEASSTAVTGAAMCTLCLLASTEKAFLEMIESKLSPDLVSSIVEGASSTDSTVQHNSILCIQLLSALGSLKQAFALHMAKSSATVLFLRVFGTSAFAQLLEALLTAGSSDERLQATTTCAAAAAEHGGGEELGQILNSLPVLLLSSVQHLAGAKHATGANALQRTQLNAACVAAAIQQTCHDGGIELRVQPSAASEPGQAAALACVQAMSSAVAASPATRQTCLQLLASTRSQGSEAEQFVDQLLAVPCMAELELAV